MKMAAIIGAIVAVAAIGFGAYMVDIDQTEEASLPNVDLTVEGGNLPELEADVGDIDMGSQEVTVNVPTIDVESPEEAAADEN